MTDAERLAARAVQIATSQVGVREEGGRNRGPMVDRYLREGGGLDPENHAYPWCVAFAVWSFLQAAEELQLPAPFGKAASVGKLWRLGIDFHTSAPGAGVIFLHLADPSDLYSPGHAGIVCQVRADGQLDTVEGNTNDSGSREGDGVYFRTRPRSFANLGFIDLTHVGGINA